MTHKTEHTKNIEAEITREREALADSLSDLAGQFSPDQIVHTVGDTLKSQSETLARTVVDGVRENPVAVGLMGAGLAWLLLGNSGKSARSGPADYDHRDVGTSPGLNSAYPSGDFTSRVDAADAEIRRQEFGEPTRLEKLRDTAAQMRDKLYDGTAQLSDVARDRVIAARRKAIEAQEKVEEATRAAASKSKGVYAEHPLAVGAGLAVIGALAALSLPRTDTEDEAFGAHRDALIEKAEDIFREEMARAKAMGQAALSEMEEMADEAVEAIPSGEKAVDLAEARLRQSGARIKASVEEAAAKS